MHDASIVAVRGYELGWGLGWLAGVWVVWRHGTRFLAGVYTGASLLTMWDWILNDGWFFRSVFDDRMIRLMVVDDRPFILQTSFAYAAFFGVTTLVALRYRDALDRLLGRWQYIVIGASIGWLDVPFAWVVIRVLKIYRFDYHQYMVLAVPLTNIVFITIAQGLMLWFAREAAGVLERGGAVAILGPGEQHGRSAPEPGAPRAAEFLLGLVIPAAAVYLAALPTLVALNWLKPR